MARVKRSPGEETLAHHLTLYRIPFVREHRFHPTRKWRFDFAFPAQKLAAEVEGGTWSGGRHTYGLGYENDCEKHAEAAVLGWTVLRFTTSQVNRGYALDVVRRILGA